MTSFSPTKTRKTFIGFCSVSWLQSAASIEVNADSAGLEPVDIEVDAGSVGLEPMEKCFRFKGQWKTLDDMEGFVSLTRGAGEEEPITMNFYKSRFQNIFYAPPENIMSGELVLNPDVQDIARYDGHPVLHRSLASAQPTMKFDSKLVAWYSRESIGSDRVSWHGVQLDSFSHEPLKHFNRQKKKFEWNKEVFIERHVWTKCSHEEKLQVEILDDCRAQKNKDCVEWKQFMESIPTQWLLQDLPDDSSVVTTGLERSQDEISASYLQAGIQIVYNFHDQFAKHFSPWNDDQILLSVNAALNSSAEISPSSRVSKIILAGKHKGLQDRKVVRFGQHFSLPWPGRKWYSPALSTAALVKACRNGQTIAVSHLLHAGVKIDFESFSSAAQGGHLDIVKLFIDKGAVANQKDRNNYTVLDNFVDELESIEGDNIDNIVPIVKLLLDNGAQPLEAPNDYTRNAFQNAVRQLNRFTSIPLLENLAKLVSAIAGHGNCDIPQDDLKVALDTMYRGFSTRYTSNRLRHFFRRVSKSTSESWTESLDGWEKANDWQKAMVSTFKLLVDKHNSKLSEGQPRYRWPQN